MVYAQPDFSLASRSFSSSCSLRSITLPTISVQLVRFLLGHEHALVREQHGAGGAAQLTGVPLPLTRTP
jgi:hypothetical protein